MIYMIKNWTGLIVTPKRVKKAYFDCYHKSRLEIGLTCVRSGKLFPTSLRRIC